MNLIIGGGQVGQALAKVFTDCCILDKGDSCTLFGMDFIHIAFPYSDVDEYFFRQVMRYAEMYSPKIIIIHSTVLPGTTDCLDSNTGIPCVYSFMIGQHDELYESLNVFEKWIAGKDEGAVRKVEEYFKEYGLRVVNRGNNAKELELGKLLSTTRYAMNIAFAQEQERICRDWNLDYSRVVTDLETMFNIGTMEMGRVELQRPLVTPGVIGGHCCMPNIKLLKKIVKSPFLRLIEKSNKEKKCESN